MKNLRTNKTHRVCVRLTDNEYNELKQLSKENNIKISDIIRNSLKENEILKNYYRKTN